MSHEILIIDDYLTIQECDELVKIFDTTPFRTTDTKINTWTNRVKWPQYPEHLKKKISDDRLKLAEKHFDMSFKIDNLNITLWSEGHEMRLHSDYGANFEFPQRDYASIIYLNDEYTGGNLVIPDLEITLSPKKGQLVTFRGSKYKHGVTRIETGRRLTSICWLCDDSI